MPLTDHSNLISDPAGVVERRPLVTAGVFGLLVILVFVATAGVELYTERRHAIEGAERSTANLARMLEEHSRLTFESVLQSLRSAEAYLDGTPGARRIGNRTTRETLRHIVDAVPYLSDLKATDEKGILVSDVLDAGIVGVDFSFKPAFTVLRDNPALRFVVSKAENNPKYGGWVIFVAMRMVGADGAFRGVAVGALDVNYFNRFYEAINIGREGAIKLVRRDGVILTRRPEGFIGTSVGKGPLFVTHLPRQPAGTVDVVAATDGLRRILSYRAVAGLPLVVVASASMGEVLAPWWRQVYIVSLGVSMITMLVLGLFMLFRRTYRRQMTASTERHDLEAQFLSAIEHIDGGVALYDPDDRMVMCNSAYRAQWASAGVSVRPGATFETLLRGSIAAGQFVPPTDDVDDWIAERLAARGRSGPPNEIFTNERWHLNHEERLPDGYIINFTPDITEIKSREQQSREAMETAEQADSAKTRFLEAANHDMRQPLQALNLMSYALAKQPDNARNPEIIDNMRHAIDAMESVLNGLLDIGKFEAGRIVPRQSDFRLDELFGRMKAEFSLQAQSNGIDLSIVRSSLAVRSDLDLVSRIIENFLSNALRYTEAGRVLLGARRHGKKVCIEVWDTGSGIPKDQLENIFEEFYQLENPARDRTKGLGLGLSIVARIAELLETPIDVRSTVDGGSMFAITLPKGDATARLPRIGRTTPTAAVPLSNSILVIEDDVAVLEATRILLESLGARVHCAMNGEDALDLIEHHNCKPDLVVSDHRLPDGETGVDLLRRIGAALERAVPGVIITGDTSEAIIREARLAGYPVLRKPVDPERLREYVDLSLAS